MILIVDMNWKQNSLGYNEFVQPIAMVAEKLANCTIRHYLELNNDELKFCNWIILSGTALEDTATLNQAEKFQWLKKTESPVLGICAGMETVGLVYGTKLSKCLEIGMTEITTLKKNQLFSGDFKAYSLHTYCIKPSNNFEVLAKSAKCIQAIKHKHKKIYGVLFHPEVRNIEIIKQFIKSEV